MRIRATIDNNRRLFANYIGHGEGRPTGGPTGWLFTCIAVLAVLFPSLWFTDMIFAIFADRDVKLWIWAGLIACASLYILGRSLASPTVSSRPISSPQASPLVMASMIIYLLISHLLSPPAFGYSQLISLVILVPFSAVLGKSANGAFAARTLACIGASVVLLVLHAVVILDVHLTGFQFYEFRPASTGSNEGKAGYQGLSLHCGLAVVFIAWLLTHISYRSIIRVGIATTLLGLCLFIQASIGGRSSLIGTAMALLVLILIAPGSLRSRSLLITLLATTAGLYVLASTDDSILPLGVKRLLFLASADSSDDSSMRIELWTRAINLWISSPFVFFFGLGSQQFPLSAGYFESGMYPHNFALEALVEYGAIGGGLILTVLLKPLLWTVRYNKFRSPDFAIEHNAFLFAVYVYWTTAMMFMGGLQSIWPLAFLAYLIEPTRASTSIKPVAHP